MRRDLTGDRGQQTASIVGDLLRKTIVGSRHILRQPPAIAFDVAHIEAARLAGVQRIAVHDAESGATYRASFEDFCSKAIRLDRGAGPQLALPLRYWQADGVQVQTISSPAAERPPAARQLAFWGTP